ncbi:L,D-transpeptidase [Acuticoccus sp. I52.16.1]|uniref:L,D-transpeptidase n=1 Tax=Acuticoccus sp. I52.16.1 TaxID=2928472 RepID=UPI001FD3AFD8|nr:L,D-transpeptidase [Acuticoccus sp. I52.16.1]UOM36086.1 L,D-transpeptidase [Acuticoccus sp. I52.16.1]
MRQVFTGVFAAALVLSGMIATASTAQAARVTATIDLSQQRMYVSVGKSHAYTWAISSGRKGYRTPTGTYRPTRMYRKYYSRKYDGSPMPNSIFFRGGYAIHGTGYVKNLGRPASHGCVRLHPSNAKTLYNLVQQHGPGNTRIRIRY